MMNHETLRHNIEFIARGKPTLHPVNKHLLAIDTRGMPADLFHDLQQALLDVGIRYHLQAIREGQLMCFDRKAFEMMQEQTATGGHTVSVQQEAFRAVAE
jgi:hypothetical protein